MSMRGTESRCMHSRRILYVVLLILMQEFTANTCYEAGMSISIGNLFECEPNAEYIYVFNI